MKERRVIGWREWVGFPDLGIPHIKAKVDTGARTSCLHAFYVKPFMRDGQEWLRFHIHPVQRDKLKVVRCEARVLEKRVVRDSGGHEEQRYVIRTSISIGDTIMDADVTLTDRDTMKFRVLLGRTAMRGEFVVDPGRSYVIGKRPRSKAKKKALPAN